MISRCIFRMTDNLGIAFRELKDIGLYPSVGMKRPQAHLSVNFGQKPFAFDIDSLVAVRAPKLLQLVHHLQMNRMRKRTLSEISIQQTRRSFILVLRRECY